MKHIIPPEKFNEHDSRQETEEHIKTVQGYLNTFAEELKERGRIHDASKLQDPEKQMFDKATGCDL